MILHTKASARLSRCELVVNSKDRTHHALDYRRYLTHLVASRVLVPCRRRLDPYYFGDRCDCDNNQARDRSGCVGSGRASCVAGAAPGLVVKLRGIILQSDKTSVPGAWIIRPVEMLDLHLAGIGRSLEAPPLAMHAGLHVVLEDDREFVVEQLLGNLREDLVDGLNWTPLETFRKRATFCRQSDGPSPRLRNACGRPCVDVAEARSAARSRRGTPPAGGHSAQVARSHNAVECPEWPPLDSSCHGMAANIRSRRWTHLVRST